MFQADPEDLTLVLGNRKVTPLPRIYMLLDIALYLKELVQLKYLKVANTDL